MSTGKSVATQHSRRQRRTDSGPYARNRHNGTQNSWGISGIFKFITGLSWSSQNQQDERVSEDTGAQQANLSDGESTENIEPADNEPLDNEPADNTPPNNATQPPISPVSQPTASGSALPRMAPDYDPLAEVNENTVLQWFDQKRNEQSSVNALEVLGFHTFWTRCTGKTFEPEQFHFSGTPSTPNRSPDNDLTSPSPVPPVPPSSKRPAFSGSSSLPPFTNNTPSAKRRMLNKDPNGSLHWQGAGKARVSRARSRHCSAAGGTTQTTPKTDNSKRRRVHEERNYSSPSGMSTSQSAPSSGLGNAGAGPSTPSKLSDIQRLPRASIVRPLSTPTNPSPLRQVVNGASPGSSGSPSSRLRTSPTHANGVHTRTRAASVLAEMIEKVTPPPKPDIANPYETASPVKPVSKPKERKRMSERRARGVQIEKEKEKEQEIKKLSAKTIIEATVPKGAKRSRPPPGLGRSKGSVDAGDDESHANGTPEEREEEPSPKKKTRRTVTVEEVFDDDEDMTGGTSYARPSVILEPVEPPPVPVRPSTSAPSNSFPTPLNAKTSVFGSNKSSLPKEPSKLRTSFIAEEESEVPRPAVTVPNFLSNKYAPDSASSQTQRRKEPKDIAMEMDESKLPVFVFNVSIPAIGIEYPEARAKALSLPESSLPTFDFSKAMSNISAPSPAPEKTDFTSSATSEKSSLTPPTNPPVKAFDWKAAGIAPKPKSGGETWTCGTCMLSNPASATEKCSVCETPR